MRLSRLTSRLHRVAVDQDGEAFDEILESCRFAAKECEECAICLQVVREELGLELRARRGDDARRAPPRGEMKAESTDGPPREFILIKRYGRCTS